MYSTLIFDLDGTLLDSASLKIESMRKALNEFDHSIVNEFLIAFKAGFGNNREWHFKNFFYSYLKGEKDFTHFYEYYSQKYADYISQNYSKCLLCDNAYFVIEELHHLNKHLYIATGTLESEAKQVLREKNMDKFFIDIYGAPNSKSDCIKNILDNVNNKNPVILIGDAKHDQDCASQNNIDFLYIEKYSTSSFDEIKKNSIKYFYHTNSFNNHVLLEGELYAKQSNI